MASNIQKMKKKSHRGAEGFKKGREYNSDRNQKMTQKELGRIHARREREQYYSSYDDVE